MEPTLLEKQPSCHRCMFRKRGLLLIGLFTILIGITAVITSKLVWPVIVSTYEKSEATVFDAIEVPTYSFNHTVNHTYVMSPKTADLKRVKQLKEQEGMPQRSHSFPNSDSNSLRSLSSSREFSVSSLNSVSPCASLCPLSDWVCHTVVWTSIGSIWP